MASIRFAVLIATSCGALLLAASASSSSLPAVYGVGNEMGWAVPPPGSATDALNEWAARHRFLVGDVLDFKYSSDDSVLLVRQGDYERCSAASPVSRFADGGGTNFTFGHPGLFYFISGAPARCEAGQRMVVRVVDAARRSSLASGAPMPAPAPGTQPSDAPPPVRRRLSLAQKQFAAAAIGFGAGFLLIFLSVWFCICCGYGN